MPGENTFENTLEELEKIVGELEAGNVGLDDGLKLYEKGVNLYKICKIKIDKAEKKIQKLDDDLNEVDIETD
ncbi:MAG: exodeoxyribonuclease VII small subunit [Halobacteriovoraceae bacterium]|nr:exodeoxyribonuclease VII small subunit [Halobacteriovoraceae bacterium]